MFIAVGLLWNEAFNWQPIANNVIHRIHRMDFHTPKNR